METGRETRGNVSFEGLKQPTVMSNSKSIDRTDPTHDSYNDDAYDVMPQYDWNENFDKSELISQIIGENDILFEHLREAISVKLGIPYQRHGCKSFLNLKSLYDPCFCQCSRRPEKAMMYSGLRRILFFNSCAFKKSEHHILVKLLVSHCCSRFSSI